MSRPLPQAFGALALLVLLAALGACNDAALVTDEATAVTTQSAIRYNGAAVKLGNGVARTYLLVDRASRDPREIGVALSERALDGLPGGSAMQMQLLQIPPQNATPYRFVELDWNPAGHEPAAVYGVPHFDFHFYTVSVDARNSIVPTDPEFAARAANFPTEAFRPPFYLDAATAAGAPAAVVTVPQMGLHWFDVRSPELQAIEGNPAGFQPFTKTFMIGSWDGRFIFSEPMITRAYLLDKRSSTDPAVRDETNSIPVAQRYDPAGFYPGAYRIAYNAQAHEFLVALTQLASRE